MYGDVAAAAFNVTGQLPDDGGDRSYVRTCHTFIRIDGDVASRGQHPRVTKPKITVAPRPAGGVADIDVGFAGGGETQVNPMLKELFDEYP